METMEENIPCSVSRARSTDLVLSERSLHAGFLCPHAADMQKTVFY